MSPRMGVQHMRRWFLTAVVGLVLGLLLAATQEVVMYQQESAIFEQIVKNLRGAKEVNSESLKRVLEPLLSRVEQDGITSAIAPLQNAVKSLSSHPNPAELYKDIITAWYFTDPEGSLHYLFTSVKEGMVEVKNNQNATASVTYVDYQLLLDFLAVLIKLDQKVVVSRVLDDLGNKIVWFSDTNKRDLDYFVMSIELDWLETLLLVRTKELPSIIKTVDFSVLMQEKTMALVKYIDQPDYAQTLKLLNLMQGQLAVQVLRGLLTIKPQGPRTQGAEKYMEAVVKAVLSERRDPKSMQKMLQDLKSASSLLHTL